MRDIEGLRGECWVDTSNTIKHVTLDDGIEAVDLSGYIAAEHINADDITALQRVVDEYAEQGVNVIRWDVEGDDLIIHCT